MSSTLASHMVTFINMYLDIIYVLAGMLVASLLMFFFVAISEFIREHHCNRPIDMNKLNAKYMKSVEKRRLKKERRLNKKRDNNYKL